MPVGKLASGSMRVQRSLAITADTYASVLTEIARQAADAVAARIPRATTDSGERR